MALLYPDGHPYGRRSKGTIDGRRAPDARRAARACTRERFAPSELTAVVVGDVDARTRVGRRGARVRRLAAAAAAADRRCRRRARGDATAGGVVIPMMNKAQADIAYGFIDDHARAIRTTTPSG